MLKDIEKSDILIGVFISIVFVIVGIFTHPNTFSNKIKVSPSGFTDTGQVCIIDNVSYDVVVDNYSKVVYLLNPRQNMLTVLYNTNLKPITIKEYDSR